MEFMALPCNPLPLLPGAASSALALRHQPLDAVYIPRAKARRKLDWSGGIGVKPYWEVQRALLFIRFTGESQRARLDVHMPRNPSSLPSACFGTLVEAQSRWTTPRLLPPNRHKGASPLRYNLSKVPYPRRTVTGVLTHLSLRVAQPLPQLFRFSHWHQYSFDFSSVSSTVID